MSRVDRLHVYRGESDLSTVLLKRLTASITRNRVRRSEKNQWGTWRATLFEYSAYVAKYRRYLPKWNVDDYVNVKKSQKEKKKNQESRCESNITAIPPVIIFHHQYSHIAEEEMTPSFSAYHIILESLELLIYH